MYESICQFSFYLYRKNFTVITDHHYLNTSSKLYTGKEWTTWWLIVTEDAMETKMAMMERICIDQRGEMWASPHRGVIS